MNINKNYIYIDFEAISNPFARILGIPANTPFAYSLGGINSDNKLETKTFIIDFHKTKSIKEIWSKLKQNIIKHIYQINSHLKINEVVFIGHNPILEKQILSRLFPKNQIQPLIDDKNNPNLSLSKLTGTIFKDEYFLRTKKSIIESNIPTLKKIMLKNNGFIASFVGFWLYVNSLSNLRLNDKRKKYFLPLQKNSLLKELKAYSKDDVNKMLFLALNPNQTNILIKRYLYKKELLRLLKNIDFDSNLTIAEIKEKIWNL
ncbi:Hypothetical protein MAU_6040 [Metamycoplasma auris 15026]|uniref:DUF2779 domain-containing protein n=1 Tax=Metamycoplasma auris 15026 TaxID=1188233 RepID=N9VAT4_9BACT|nr:DUF2779 domain-containing protein [Metamycoplasma auris]ENY68526.1 Hypothetical protein MAU_6040 [Metamycoplasma auris 15026]